MEWIKRFEELNSNTYRSAGDHLININKISRGQKLIDYADEKDFGFYNVWWGNTNSAISKKPLVFTNPKSDFIYNVFKITRGGPKANDIKHKLSNKGPEELVKDWYDGVSSLSFTINFTFKTAGESLKVHDRLKRWKVPLFSINFQIAEWVEKEDFEGVDDDPIVKNALDLYQHMDGYHYPQISIQRPLDDHYFGIFSDRKSANKFKRDVLGPAIEEHHDKIFEIFSIIGASAKDSEKAIKAFKNIRTNYLYDESIGRSNPEQLWYNNYGWDNEMH